MPRSVDALRALPGIGPYSAGAIASIAHGERAPLVDGNVVRVLCRAFGLRGDPSRSALKAELWGIAGQLVPEGRPGDFNQALMELGATVCTARSPRCGACPLARKCVATRAGIVDEFPESPPRPKTVMVRRVAALVRRGQRILCVQVPDGAPRWAGMWQFPNADLAKGEPADRAAERAVLETVGLHVTAKRQVLTVRHSVTHHRVTLDVHECAPERKSFNPRVSACKAFAFEEPSRLEALAMPAAHRRIARFLLSQT